jgi:hypothetical protein
MGQMVEAIAYRTLFEEYGALEEWWREEEFYSSELGPSTILRITKFLDFVHRSVV